MFHTTLSAPRYGAKALQVKNRPADDPKFFASVYAKNLDDLKRKARQAAWNNNIRREIIVLQMDDGTEIRVRA